jgi:hypothetical protein
MWWTLLLGPVVSLFPRRWRKALPFHAAVHWYSGSIVSGVLESALATGGLVSWYSYCVSTWVSRLMDNAARKAGPVEITDHDVGFAALLVVATHPLTWLIAYFVVEGAVRLCAAFTDTVLGVLPLYLFDKLYCKVRGIKEALPPGTPVFTQSHAASYVGSFRDKVMAARLTALPDELLFATASSEEILEIRASHAKPEWDPPRIVRFEDRYYRLEESSRGSAPRPFVYRLKRLSRGVPSRTVLIYAPNEAPVIAGR